MNRRWAIGLGLVAIVVMVVSSGVAWHSAGPFPTDNDLITAIRNATGNGGPGLPRDLNLQIVRIADRAHPIFSRKLWVWLTARRGPQVVMNGLQRIQFVDDRHLAVGTFIPRERLTPALIDQLGLTPAEQAQLDQVLHP